MDELELIDNWVKYIECRIEKDVEVVCERYIEEYGKDLKLGESEKYDMRISFYELMSKLYCINK